MATVNLGRIKFVWQGAYSGATAYVADDVVSYNGSSYICILASTNNLPTNATYWNLMAQSGTDITSLAGLAQGDVLYYNGTSWVRLGAGTSGQFLKTNGSGANPAWATVSTNHNGVAWLEYQDTAGSFRSLDGATGMSSGDRIVMPFNTTLDPYDILGTIGSNTFQVNATCAYLVSIHLQVHTPAHYKLFLYNDTDGAFAPRPNGTFTGAETFQAPVVAYATTQGNNVNVCDTYYLQTGKTYSVRQSSDNMGGFSTSASYLFGNYSVGGITSRNTLARTCITKLSGV